MLRGLFYGSYRKPRELVWIFGVAIFLCLMGEAFMGYLLPWGQMSYWGAQVIVNLFSAIPFVGPELSIRSEEHTSELQSLMRISYAVFCLKKKKNTTHHITTPTIVRQDLNNTYSALMQLNSNN